MIINIRFSEHRRAALFVTVEQLERRIDFLQDPVWELDIHRVNYPIRTTKASYHYNFLSGNVVGIQNAVLTARIGT